MAKAGKKRQAAQYGVQDIGVRGRRTGISVPETGKRDEYGMEDLEDFFNREPRSASKRAAIANRTNSSANKRQKPHQDVTNSQEVTMEEVSVPTPPSNRVSPKRRSIANNAPNGTPRQASIARRLTFEGSADKPTPQRQKSIFKQPARPFALASPAISNGTPNPLEASGLRKVQKRQSSSQHTEDNYNNAAQDDVFVDAEPIQQDYNESDPTLQLTPESPHKRITKQYAKSPSSARKSYRSSLAPRQREPSPSTGSGDDLTSGNRDLVGNIEEQDDVQEQEEEEEEEEVTQPDVHEDGYLSLEQEDVSPEPVPAISNKAKGKQTAGSRLKQNKGKTVAKNSRQTSTQSKSRTRKESPAGEHENEEEQATGLRRSSRARMSPLAYWRNERIVYELVKRRQSGPLVPEIKEIIKVESPRIETRPKNKRGTTSKKPAAAAAAAKKERQESQELSEPEEWAERGYVSANISGFGLNSQSQSRAKIAFSGSAIKFAARSEHSLRICKMYEDDQFLAAGFIELPKNGFKSLKNVKENSVFFCVVSGSAEITIADAVFILKQGGTCWVPRGNFYSIANKSKTTSARLFFAQGTNTLENEELGVNKKS